MGVFNLLVTPKRPLNCRSRSSLWSSVVAVGRMGASRVWGCSSWGFAPRPAGWGVTPFGKDSVGKVMVFASRFFENRSTQKNLLGQKDVVAL